MYELFYTSAELYVIIKNNTDEGSVDMRIAVCDDETRDADKIEFALMDIAGDLEVDKFSSGKDFIRKVKTGSFYDLVFMDIYIGEENGMDVIRSMQEFTPSTQVIFSTASKDHAVEAFDLNAAGYLVKPYSEADVVKVFARAGLRRERSAETVMIRSGTDRQLFRVPDVVKIESDDHYTKVTLVSGNVSRFHLSFSDVSGFFKNGFVEIKRGLSVNMAHIERIKSSVVYLTDGSSYRITRLKKDDVIREYTSFIVGLDR